MNSVFADTSYYVALLSPTDSLHRKAVELTLLQNIRIVLTNFILLELGNMFKEGDHRPKLVAMVEQLRSKSNVLIVPATRTLLQKSLDLFGSRPDKNWSLTDCSSFVVMDEYRVTSALSSDHHFEQAGFTILLK